MYSAGMGRDGHGNGDPHPVAYLIADGTARGVHVPPNQIPVNHWGVAKDDRGVCASTTDQADRTMSCAAPSHPRHTAAHSMVRRVRRSEMPYALPPNHESTDMSDHGGRHTMTDGWQIGVMASKRAIVGIHPFVIKADGDAR